jgi:hypothetical protein
MGAHQGQRGLYRWLWSREGRLRDLVQRVPELVRGCFVVVSSFDSGPLRLAPEEAAAGWYSDGRLALSPKVEDIDLLPLGEWDEWYVFDAPPELSEIEVFVNYGDFSPDPDRRLGPQGIGWGRRGAEEALRFSLERTERFWSQLEAMSPEAFLAENDAMICVTRDAGAFARAVEYAWSLASSAG